MALSLTAYQKDLIKIFKIEEQYIIPAYQRPYSWGYDECFQFYNDIMKACLNNEDYFIGNTIIAKSDENRDVLEVIDGQQRLTTILLLIKVLSILHPEMSILRQMLELEDWKGKEKKPRLVSEIFEYKDASELDQVLNLNEEQIFSRYTECLDRKGQINERKGQNRFEINTLHFYNWLSYYQSQENDLKEFISFLLRRVYLLPIELHGKTREEANEKALVIFETINNRGMSLEDADIFKAKLYEKAKKVQEERSFIEQWIDFKINCEKLNVDVDEIFRYYSHLIRGKRGITSNEINLREFFIRQKESPLELKGYEYVMNDLFQIINVLELIQKMKQSETKEAKWIQLIEAYSNQYPKFALVTYLFNNYEYEESNFLQFLESLVRYFYYMGPTTTVKFETYNMIKQISLGQNIERYCQQVEYSHFQNIRLRSLKYPYALLAFYLKHPVGLINYSFDRLINRRELQEFPDAWDKAHLESLVDEIGNFLVLDIPRRNLSLNNRIVYYQNSNLQEVKEMTRSNSFNVDALIARDIRIKKLLVDFFNCTL